jgi:hypothetical protein
MARTRSVDFLPEIFQTDANKQFLAATLDQLIQEPKFKKTQGFIGRTVGPGANPNDKYVIEPNKTRADYQLEPGVVSLIPDTDTIKNAITYPGMNDAIGFQGGNQARPDQLYESNYYTWDPFIDYDSFVNFSQYFWLPNGPQVVDVHAAGVAVTDNFVVNRENGVYTFSGVPGDNPRLELVRGGSYTFQVAQNAKETVNYRVRNTGTSAYSIDFENNPTLTLARGNTYVFNLALTGVYPFWIKDLPTTGISNAYDSGVTRNGSAVGSITFTVPQDAPNVLYYVAENQSNMQGILNIVDGTPGTGPGFWIQTNPGISGKNPATPNISSREVLGVINNGEDLGTITFNVPYKTAQNFYYSLTSIGTVDLLTTMNFNEINNQPVDQFIATYGGIDGITYLNGRTLVIYNDNNDVEDGGWYRTTLYDPLPGGSGYDGQIGSFDTTAYDQVTPLPFDNRYQIYTISYVNTGGTNFINLNQTTVVNSLEKFTIRYGTQYSNTDWYKDAAGYFEQIPVLSAALDSLWYQDGTDPEIFSRIDLIDQTESTTIFVEDIIGQKNYTAPNGVVFSNGIKIRFTGDVYPSSYSSGIGTIDCISTDAATDYIITASTSTLYVGQEIIFTAPTIGGLVAGQSYYVSRVPSDYQFAVSETLGGVPTSLSSASGNMSATTITVREYYVSGVGTAIELLPTTNFVTPETYVVDAYDSTLATEPNDLDYITISRASRDLNPWTRSNRWFHIDVINASAVYNNTTATFDNNYRAKRPIIQFRPNIRLFNMGTEGKSAVDIIDFSQTDAFSNVQGSTSYSVDGYQVIDGTRIVFAADEDVNVRSKIWMVQYITPDTAPPLPAPYAGPQPIINLVETHDGQILVDDCVVCLDGDTLKGLTFWYDGAIWFEAQQKTSVQQPPLFNVYDPNGISFGNRAVYPASDFVGSKLFSYAIGDTGILDTVLQFPLKYLNLTNVGDIIFDNNLYSDSFVYTRDNVSVTLPISSGSSREYVSRQVYDRLIGWQNAVTTTKTYQQFKFVYDGTPLKLDVRVNDQAEVPVLKIYVGSAFKDPTKYTYTRNTDGTIITLISEFALGDVIEVLALSDQTSRVAFYQVPINLENNPLNANSPSFTLGTIRQQYQSICENLPTIVGNIAGANNTRDLGNIVPYGLIILQQSAPLTLAGYFLRSEAYNIFNSLTFNSREYLKYKNQMLDIVTQLQIQVGESAGNILDSAVEQLTAGKIETQPFYWSDMLPSGAIYLENTYTVSFITTNVFDTVQVYNYTSANYLGLNVYLNGVLLTRDLEYVVATDGPRVTITAPLVNGDQVTIREYSATYGSFVPNTPTKLGLYPAYRPQITVEKTSTGEQTVLVGHDGSITKTFDDVRDSVLLEFETRIFNNLKLDGNPIPLTVDDVIPGQFRDTGFSLQNVNDILGQDFLSYVAWNKLDYVTQKYSATNEFSWNYSSAQNKLNNENLLGAWRGIYRYFYDTQQPEYTPWEMLGFSIKPVWWDDTYGTAPYTKDNLVLWDDLEAGYVRDPVGGYVLPQFVRPGLTQVIPTGSEGELLPPFESVVGNYDENQFRKSWKLGDGGPAEASWWNSSAYPFSVMRLLAVTRPAKFFALFADRDLYRYNEEFQQFLYEDRYRLNANQIVVYGDGTSKASYIDWIVDYNRQSGINSTADLQADLDNLDVRLCYRMASFSDKQYIKLFTEKSSPNSTNATFLIPDESYNLLLYKNQSFARAAYSSMVIQKVETGWAVFGYGSTQPYFNILQSLPTGQFETIAVAGVSVQVPKTWTTTVVQIPYGFVFSSLSAVSTFLLSYGRYLESIGLEFTNRVNGYNLTWNQMVQEFLYWTQQGWDENALLNLNPLAFKLSITKEQAIVDSIQAQTAENIVLDQNKRELNTRNLNIVRIDNTFTVEPLNDQSISFLDIKFTSYEHMIVLNNQSVFGDLIYEPTTGARQSRLNFIAVTTTEWNGSLDAQGFILNRDNIEEWSDVRTYSKGEIVKYKGSYWSSLTIVQPSTNFDYNVWVQSDYTQIELGLLPNLANKANQLQNSYNINTANIESDNDLMSYGLIGYRPRQYMAALNLDDVSQLNVYRQFLGSKGTLLSAELFAGANLGKEAGDYQIYENWAVQRAVYGANANRSFFELRLNRALLSANPSLVEIINPLESSKADQTILVEDIWRESFNITSPNILPVTTELPTDTALPSAGYVNFADADITTFNIDDNTTFLANLNNINVGTSIWAAKVNDYDWGIFRAQAVPGVLSHLCDNLNQTSRAIFTKQHGLSVGDRLIIRDFDPAVNGVYTVLGVPTIDTITIAYTFVGNRTVINGTGLGFTLQTMRVAQASDIVNLPYVNNISTGAKVWVDNNGNNRWEVLEKQQVFSSIIELGPVLLDANEQYGSSVAQARNRFAALVGSPKYGFGAGTEKGAVYVYVKNTADQYQPISPLPEGDAILTLDVTGARSYGSAIDFGNQTWAVAGAPASLGSSSQANNGYACVIYRDPSIGQPGVNPYVQWQLLTTPDSVSVDQGEFGYSVAMSLDERWMYVSAPGVNKVYAYGRVDWEDQFVRNISDGVTTQYSISETIQISANTQLVVTVDDTLYLLNTNYTVSADLKTVILLTLPSAGSVVTIRRLSQQLLDGGTYFNVPQSATSGSGVNAQFTIVRVRGEVGQPGGENGSVSVFAGGSGYGIGNTITIAGSSFGGTNNIVLTITGVNSGAVASFNIAYTPPALATVFSLNEYLFTATNIYSFNILVDDVLQRPNIDYTFDNTTKDVTMINSPVQGARIVARAKGYFEYVDSLPTSGLGLISSAQFGHSVSCSTDGRQVMVGAPYQTIDGQVEAGAVYVFDRDVQKFIYGTDPSSVTFTVLGTPTAPVSVIVNNSFLINETDDVINGSNTFAVSGSNITVNTDLQVGDIVEIETNEFKYVQTVTQNEVAGFSNFGTSTDLCSYNCSLYAGAPQSSIQVYKGGVVERQVNQAKTYGTITAGTANPSLTVGNTLRVNNIDVTVPAATSSVTSLQGLVNAINTAVPNVVAKVTNGYLTISVYNSDAAPTGNKLQVAPGTVGTVFADCGFETFVWTQTILSPYPIDFAAFGQSLSVDDSATNLVVGSPNGTLYLETLFDDGTTFFDAGSTIFFSIIIQSGAAYTYDYLPSASASVSNPGKFAFGDQISTSNVGSYDRFGLAVNYTSGNLMIGAPGNDWEDSAESNYGGVFVFENATRTPAWSPIHVQQPTVDIRLLNSVFLYDRITSATTEFLDFFNPLQGKILGAVKQNINYLGAVDPASYNVGPNNIRGTTWNSEHVGEIWWDISTVRFIDPNQDDIVYASRRWGQIFPGSAIDMYQWIVSSVPPAEYAGPGTTYNNLSYTVNTVLSKDGTFNTQYFFWVKGLTTVATQKNKTLDVTAMARYIADPKSSGIAYIAPINASTIALYNCESLIDAQDTIIDIEYDKVLTNDNVHTEYELIPQDRADGFLSNNLYRKLQDSFCGVDTFGNLVPDPNLTIAERYGVQFRPRQSMFVDRFTALKNYLIRANFVLNQYPISESRNFNLLNSAEPIPSSNSGLWDMMVPNLEVLGYQNIYNVPLGYTYLVESDANNKGLWSIYTVTTPVKTPTSFVSTGTSINEKVLTIGTVTSGTVETGQVLVGTTVDPGTIIASYIAGEGSGSTWYVDINQSVVLESVKGYSPRELSLSRVQNYDTKQYWQYINWYMPGYNSSIKPIVEVPTYSALGTLTVPIGSSVRVTANAQNKFEIYLRTDLGWERVGLESGTISFNEELWNYALGRFGYDVEVFDAQYFDQEPVIETRKIIQAINEELFIDDLALERNKALVLMFNYVLSEFSAPEWLVKTSLIDVDHKIRQLIPYQNYTRDNQEFVSDYIQEVKPYHVQVREFNLLYTGNDQYFGDLTDFDVPSYFNSSLEVPQFTSPILLPYDHSAYQISNTLSDAASNAVIWQAWPYTQWYGNYLMTLTEIKVIDQSTGYTTEPVVTIVGDATIPATAVAILNSLGKVVAISIDNPGSGYRSTPTIEFVGTLKSVGAGQTQSTARAYAILDNGLIRSLKTTIKYDRFQYQSNVLTWSPNGLYENGTLVRYDNRVWRAENSDGSSANVGPEFNLEDWVLVPANELSGVDRTMGYYVPGVNEPGLELPLLIDNVDYPGVQVWGDYFLGVIPTDAVYQSEFTDIALGDRFTDINVEGGQFIGPYEGHAPEELVNGAEYDTLDMRVYTRPGSDWQGDGHGFQIGTIRYTYAPAVTNRLSWANVVEHPTVLQVSNVTTGLDLGKDVDYYIYWDIQEIQILSGVSAGDIVNISVYELGGGSQLYRANYIGTEVGEYVIVPVNDAEIWDAQVFVNGESIGSTTWEPYAESIPWVQNNTYSKFDVVLDSSNYYRALQDVPAGEDITNVNYWFAFVPTLLSKVTFNRPILDTDGISLVVFGYTTPEQYSWSTLVTQNIVADNAIVASQILNLDVTLTGTNPVNLIVTKNGRRLRPASSVEWIADESPIGDSTLNTSYGLPQRTGYSQQLINAYTDVTVYVNSVLQVQSFGSVTGDYYVTNWDGSDVPGRQVVFYNAPEPGSQIIISVDTVCDYQVVANTVEITSAINLGDLFVITSWNDTTQQNILTLTFVGPVTTGVTINEPYDSTSYDTGNLTGSPGTYDYTVGTAVPTNDFYLQRDNVTAGRLWVTLNGYRLFEGQDFTVENGYLILSTGAINSTDVVVVTEFAESIVPEAMAFRIFQDMRGVQATYRITPETATYLTQALSDTADVIHVADAAALDQPNLEAGAFGVITIDGERIAYRVRDLATNTLSSLRRGTAGTGAANHSVDTVVYDIGRGNLMSADLQNYIVNDTSTGDGSTTVFYAPNISIESFGDSSSIYVESIEVYVGGTRQYNYSNPNVTSEYPWICTDAGGDDSPLTIEFVTNTSPVHPVFAPPPGVEVTILTRRGVWWYGVDTAVERNLSLQESTTKAARFLQGNL